MIITLKCAHCGQTMGCVEWPLNTVNRDLENVLSRVYHGDCIYMKGGDDGTVY